MLVADEKGLTGVWFEGQKYFADVLNEDTVLMKKLELHSAVLN